MHIFTISATLSWLFPAVGISILGFIRMETVSLGTAVSRLEALYITSRTVAS